MMLPLETINNYVIALVEGNEPDMVGVTGEVYKCGMALVFCKGTSIEIGNEIAYADNSDDARVLVDAFITGVAKPSIAITLARARGTAALLERQRHDADASPSASAATGGVDRNQESLDDHANLAVVQIPRLDS